MQRMKTIPTNIQNKCAIFDNIRIVFTLLFSSCQVGVNDIMNKRTQWSNGISFLEMKTSKCQLLSRRQKMSKRIECDAHMALIQH